MTKIWLFILLCLCNFSLANAQNRSVKIFVPNPVITIKGTASVRLGQPVNLHIVINEPVGLNMIQKWEVVINNGKMNKTYTVVNKGGDNREEIDITDFPETSSVLTYSVESVNSFYNTSDYCSRIILGVKTDVTILHNQPVAVNDFNKTIINQSVDGNVATNDIDINSDILKVTEVFNTITNKDGRISIGSDGQYTFTPSLGFTGTDTYEYTICDLAGTCTKATLAIKVIAPPKAINDFTEVKQGMNTTIDVSLNDIDFDNNLVKTSVTILAGLVSGAMATVNVNGSITVDYKYIADFYGKDSLTYNICDVDNQCASANLFVDVLKIGITIPNTFSPNGDGINDYFVIPGLEKYPDNEILILNRWGNEVFKKNNYKNDWDGSRNNGSADKLPTGTYYFILNPRNGLKPVQGYIYLTY